MTKEMGTELSLGHANIKYWLGEKDKSLNPSSAVFQIYNITYISMLHLSFITCKMGISITNPQDLLED